MKLTPIHEETNSFPSHGYLIWIGSKVHGHFLPYNYKTFFKLSSTMDEYAGRAARENW